jgi:histidinol-phosphatase (PHP family)
MHVNFHTHSRFCDGHGEPADYRDAARTCGFTHLGFSSHAPVPFPCAWTMPPARLPEYAAAIRALATVLESPRVSLGMEIDWVPDIGFVYDYRANPLRLDYVIGSVHFLGILPDGSRFTVDGPPEELEAGLLGCFGGDARALVEAYYAAVVAMLKDGPVDLVGHLDLVKKNNAGNRYFDENARWYRDALLGALAAVAASGAVLEVNSGGLARGRCHELYPAPWAIAEANRLGIPVLVTSDCHDPDGLTGAVDIAEAAVREAGYRRQTLPLAGRETIGV